MKKVSLWQIFITFFKTGLFTFGGGYAMISILEEELITKKQWITAQDMLDMLVIAESTPGVIAVNTATSVGFRLRGFWGAVIATLGVVLPSFIIITGLSFVIEAIADNVWYKAAFTGIQACVIILIINAFTKMAKQLERDWFNAILVIVAFGVATFTDFNVIFLIIIGGVLGVCYMLIRQAVINKKARRLQSDETSSTADSSDGNTADVAPMRSADETRGDNPPLETADTDGADAVSENGQNGGE